MRTTVRLDDALLRAAREEALRCGTTLTALFEEALRERLARVTPAAHPRPRVRLKTVTGKGVRAGVDLSHSAALLDFMEQTE